MVVEAKMLSVNEGHAERPTDGHNELEKQLRLKEFEYIPVTIK